MWTDSGVDVAEVIAAFRTHPKAVDVALGLFYVLRVFLQYTA